MGNLYIVRMFKSHYCKVIILIMLFISYNLLPKKIFIGWYNLLAYLFIILFSLTSVCLIRSIKDKIVFRKKEKKSLISAFAGLLGLSAFQVCGIGAPMCGASVGMAILSTILPTFAFDLINDYAIYFIYISLCLQLISLFQMKCFKKVMYVDRCV